MRRAVLLRSGLRPPLRKTARKTNRISHNNWFKERGHATIDSHNQELISIRTTENINSHSVVALFEEVHEKHPDTEVTLVMDNASYQRYYFVQNHAKALGIDLLFLPSYSPNLKLIERLWKLTKRRCLTNRYYPDFGAFCGAIDKCLEDLSGPLRKELTSLMTLNFQLFKNHNS